MTEQATLSRDEYVGLGIATVAHVALVAWFLLHDQSPPRPLPIPERMEVSLAGEVSLTSTSPDPAPAQASVAPVLSADPAPEVEPDPAPPQPVRDTQPRATPPPPPPRPTARPTPTPTPRATTRPRPTPTPRATSRPSPTPTARASARPTPTPRATARPTGRPTTRPTPAPTATRGGGSRVGADFLEGAGSSQPNSNRGTPAAAAGPAVRASIQSAMARQIKPHWAAPQGVDVELLVTNVSWDLNPDGSLKGVPRIVSQTGVNDSNRPQAKLHQERAIRAIQLAAPFNLPAEYYDVWKSPRNVRFDRNF
ncbi:energy transducer TonB [Altererythrobacter xixiisoli]|uniref:Energy transducer TonB n=1 Tax=Croceibacterium xixiisoli TaxID=1476466 RepID=A0A6I4TWZ7_9SPHN|nr:energy transducer TonB [Croceibacterium xixiisoli]MXP00547.1 energy transducer TonB [Croceibacterium xixiisoli]